jgi:recombination protein RecA
MYGEGVSKTGELVDIGSDLEILQKSGSWYSYEGTKLGQGREGVKQLLQDNPELAAEIEKKIRAKFMAGVEILKTEPVGDEEE